jgi:hypothetical protein
MSDEQNIPASNSSEPQASFDDPWKEGLELYFEPFLAFFFPVVHKLIDWSRSYESLEQEFQKFVKDSELGKRFTDKLFKVWRQDGEETWILVHVEVQSQEDSGFAERMFVYNYRCFDRYRKPVVSLAVLGDERPTWRPSSYVYDLGGCRVGIEFPIAKLVDYEARWEELNQSRNPFVVVVMAHLKTKATTGQPQQRKQWKWTLVRKLFEQGYSKNDVVELFRLIDWMMTLPDHLEREFRAELRQYQEERQMPYVTSIERLAKEEGIQEGRLETLRETIIDVLKVRFEAIPSTVSNMLTGLEDGALLKQLHLQAITVSSIEAFQKLLSERIQADADKVDS